MTGPGLRWSGRGNYSSFMFGKKIIVFDGSHYLKGQAAARTYYGLLIVRTQNQHSSHYTILYYTILYIDKVATRYRTMIFNTVTGTDIS